MLHKKIIKRIPGKIPEPSPNEKQGYVEDLSRKTKPELLELIDRQDKLLANKSFIKKLPDKGARINGFRNKLKEELAQRDEVDKTCGLLSALNIAQSDEIEWNGIDTSTRIVTKNQTLDSDDEERNPIKILASLSGVGSYKKQHRIEQQEPSLIKPEDLQDANCSLRSNKPNEAAKRKEDAYVLRLCRKIEKQKKKNKEQFLPHRTTKSGGNVSVMCKKPLGKHWEVTAATPPRPIHGDVKLISIEESLNLQKEQAAKLKDVQAKHAAEKLAAQLGVKMGSALPDSSARSAYRDMHPDFDSSSSSEDELVNIEGEPEPDYEEPEKDGAVIYNLVDEPLVE